MNSKPNTQLAARPESPSQLLAYLKGTISDVLPPQVDRERWSRVVLNAMRFDGSIVDAMRTPKGLYSLRGAILTAAKLGIEPGPLGAGYLVCIRGEVEFWLGYKGMQDLFYRAGGQTIYARELYANDHFRLTYGRNATLEHEPCLTGDRGRLKGFYAYAEHKEGAYWYDYLTIEEIEAVRDGVKAKSRNWNSSPWNNHFTPMAKKTAIRRLFVSLPTRMQEMVTAPEGPVYADNTEIVAEVVTNEKPTGPLSANGLQNILTAEPAPTPTPQPKPDRVEKRRDRVEVGDSQAQSDTANPKAAAETQEPIFGREPSPDSDDHAPPAEAPDKTEAEKLKTMRRSVGGLLKTCRIDDRSKGAIRSKVAAMDFRELVLFRNKLDILPNYPDETGALTEREEAAFSLVDPPEAAQ